MNKLSTEQLAFANSLFEIEKSSSLEQLNKLPLNRDQKKEIKKNLLRYISNQAKKREIDIFNISTFFYGDSDSNLPVDNTDLSLTLKYLKYGENTLHILSGDPKNLYEPLVWFKIYHRTKGGSIKVYIPDEEALRKLKYIHNSQSAKDLTFEELAFVSSLKKVEEKGLNKVKSNLSKYLNEGEVETVCSKVLKFIAKIAKEKNKTSFTLYDLTDSVYDKELYCNNLRLKDIDSSFFDRYKTGVTEVFLGSFKSWYEPLVFTNKTEKGLTRIYYYIPDKEELETLEEMYRDIMCTL